MSLAAPPTAKYKPEEILVCKSYDVAGNSERTFDAWRQITPNFIRFVGFSTEQTNNARIKITADAEPDIYNEDADACLPLSSSQLADIFAHKLMLIRIANIGMVAMTDYQFRYRYLVDNWTVAEKIRRQVLKEDKDFSAEELRLDRKFNLRENIDAGRLPYQFPITVTGRLKLETVIRIQEVAVNIAAIAAGSVADPTLQSDIGPQINVPAGEKVILFNIASDQPTDPAHQTFIVVDRDTDQPNYMVWNTYCFAGIDHPDSLWVPSPEQLYLHARSVVGETHFKIRYKYARCKLSLIDKIRWNIEMSSAETLTADKLDLWDRVVAGVV